MTYDFEHLKETVDRSVFTPWQEVDVEIIAFTDLGIKVAINNDYIGVVYRNQIYDDYEEGQTLKAYIQYVREDGKIDVSFQPNQAKHVASTSDKILDHLKASGGKSSLNDKSSPDDIRAVFQISKMVFKRCLSSLYKQRKINITDQGIELAE